MSPFDATMKIRNGSYQSSWTYPIMNIATGSRLSRFKKLQYIIKWLSVPKIIYSKNIYADRLCSKVENHRNIHQILILNLILSVLIMNIMKILVDSNFGGTFTVLPLLGFPNLWSLAIQYKWIKLLSSTIVVIYFLQSKIYVLQLVF